ncbi:hypothetical protein OJ996_02955 [Luteolibacter sp. GHJ8]|uniref:VWA domain-containing protein n=1 Tax=Luteolibacter rhizosphaerae TaxID=2989719 RepID=A0ABT3FY49_9BACT|nr:hypothetical protein [Luteolibacter rhizosphaerae]MCW1912516.1 hypothetical protein [Luteolibacter rhizosphaerae]
MKTFLRLPVLFLILWGLLHALGKVVRLSPEWPVWSVALLGAFVVELILFLYRYESQAVTPRRARWMISLRLAALAVLIWILVEPTWIREVERERNREVVVVLDDSASMHLQDDGASATRLAIGEQALQQSGILEKLGEGMKIRTVRAARSMKLEGEDKAEGWGDATDIASALSTVLEQVPPDDLAGVIMVSDGRHNRPGRVEDVARRFGILDAPVGLVATGSAEPPRDASVLQVNAPEAIHLGDRMRVTAALKFDGYKGKEAKVRLMRGEDIVEERGIPIPQDHHREDVRFTTIPEEGGVGGYRIEIAGLDGERFPENNAWEFETSITDARTNVLIVDSTPRWEFRYLRNLFYGRDKSVHMQYVLVHPDRIADQEDELIPASATRPFGDAQATRLPATEEEWRKFDVIILGDVDPSSISDSQWQIISGCVRDRAALLVMIAGPRAMPHCITAQAGRELVPVETYEANRNFYTAKEEPFRFALTAEGRNHPVTQQATGETANDIIWAGFPEIPWRQPVRSLKDGAEVLLTAAGPDSGDSVGGGEDLNAALDALTKRREREAASALLVTRQTGKGKVALLLTDRTWRLREGAGDLYHHRFWGNLVRWGAGPTLRAGASRVRLGTDQLTYTADDRIKVTARLRDANLSPVADSDLKAELFRDGQMISSTPMTTVEGSNGLHEVDLPALPHSGRYEVRLRGQEADRLIAEDGGNAVSAGFRVVGSRGPIELAETTLNMPLLTTVADLSGGRVVKPENVGDLAPLFIKETNARKEVRETSLWDSGLVLALFACLLASEWVIRRGGGLP